MNILVLCTGNSARSILLESILNRNGAGRVTACSAGSKPAGAVHPQSLVLLAELGHDPAGARSKRGDEFAAPQAHWGVEDPAAAPVAEQPAAFRAAFDILNRRASALLALPLETIDSGTLKTELDRIGKLS